MRDGWSLIVFLFDLGIQLSDLYSVRSKLEALVVNLLAQHVAKEEIWLLQYLDVYDDEKLIGSPVALSRVNKRFHKQSHLSNHNKFSIQ